MRVLEGGTQVAGIDDGAAVAALRRQILGQEAKPQ
jgi:hypothetical protein